MWDSFILVSALHACLEEGKKQNEDKYAHIFVFIIFVVIIFVFIINFVFILMIAKKLCGGIPTRLVNKWAMLFVNKICS